MAVASMSTAPSQSMMEELREDGIGRDIRMWTRGVDSALFNPEKRDLAWRRSLGFADNDIVVAFVGRLVLEKGIDVFVDTLLRTPHVKALVVGEGPERERFENKLKDGRFTGYLDGKALARAYASADIFFNPSITETFGNVTLEAMASGNAAALRQSGGEARRSSLTNAPGFLLRRRAMHLPPRLKSSPWTGTCAADSRRRRGAGASIIPGTRFLIGWSRTITRRLTPIAPLARAEVLRC